MSKYLVEGLKEDTGFKGENHVDEWCPHCDSEVYNIPNDRVSLCPHCGAELFPCAGCDPDNCTWEQSKEWCHRFQHSKEWIESIKREATNGESV